MAEEFGAFCHAAEADLGRTLQDGGHRMIASASELDATWHPNGFVVFELGELPSGKLRLHLWPSGGRHLRDGSEHVHTHVWDLYSTVLAGTYTEQMYEVTESMEAGAREFAAARIDYARDRNTLHPAGGAFLRPTQMVTAAAGDVHTVAAGEAHRTLIPSGEFVATLLVVSPPRRDEALIYTAETLPSPTHIRETIAVGLRAQLLDHLAETLMSGTRP